MKSKELNDKQKEELRSILSSDPRILNKQQIQKAFAPFSFDIKEFGSISSPNPLREKTKGIHFEIHYKRTFIIEVEITNMSHFRNDFIDFGEGSRGVSMGRFNTLSELLSVFINMFYMNILANVEYNAYYNSDHTWFDSEEEAIITLSYVQKLIDELNKK